MSLTLLHGKHQVRVPRTFAEIKLRIGVHTGRESITRRGLEVSSGTSNQICSSLTYLINSTFWLVEKIIYLTLTRFLLPESWLFSSVLCLDINIVYRIHYFLTR